MSVHMFGITMDCNNRYVSLVEILKLLINRSIWCYVSFSNNYKNVIRIMLCIFLCNPAGFFKGSLQVMDVGKDISVLEKVNNFVIFVQ